MKYTLRKFRESDIDSLVNYANNYNIAKFLTDGFPHPYEKQDGENFLAMAVSSDSIFTIDVDGDE